MKTFLPVSFELMRKEQQKAFQEKLKLNPDKTKDAFDITSLLDDDEKRLVNRSNESVEPPLTLAALSNDEKSSLSHATARPLVPPGFASTMLERNTVTKISSNTHATEVTSSHFLSILFMALCSLIVLKCCHFSNVKLKYR